jgi:Tfp pilus assembly protein PilF
MAATASAAGWKGAKIMPKSDRLMLQAGGSASGTIYDIAWPATVEETNGRWLYLRDEGAYNARPVAGWVYADDVLKLDEARDYYSELLRDQPEAWVHWLRGIYWESQREPGIAFLDYRQAAALDPENRLDDVHIRLGRMTAQTLFQNSVARKYSPADREMYEAHFKRVRNGRPLLYLEWGAALSLACKCHQKATAPGATDKGPEEIGNVPDGAAAGSAAGDPAKADLKKLRDAALERLAQAKLANRRWWRVPLAEAEMLLDLCRKESADGENEPNENVDSADLGQAQISFDEAITLNPNSPDAYRDRAEVLRLQYRLANPSQKIHLPGADKGAEIRQRHLLQEAKQSATTACNMTLYRQPQSLKVLAEVCADMQDIEKAAKYAIRAAEYAPEDDRDKLKSLSKKYAGMLGKGTAGTAIAAAALHQIYVPAAGTIGTSGEPQREPELYFIDRSLSAFEP